METKSFLFHDLLHFAVETEAQLKHSFYGLLDIGKSYATMSETKMEDQPPQSEIAITERIIGPLTGAIKQDIDLNEFISLLANLFRATGETLPEWLTSAFIERIQERMRKLMGEWNALPFGQGMTLIFD